MAVYETLLLAKGIGSIASGFFGKKAANAKARQARAIARYNADIALQDAQQKADAINFQATQLVKQQRKFIADSQMEIGARGGDISGGDQSLILESLQNIMTDNLNFKNAEDLALIAGENKAQSLIYQGNMQSQAYKQAGKQSMFDGIMGALSTGAGYFSQNYTPTFNPKGTS